MAARKAHCASEQSHGALGRSKALHVSATNDVELATIVATIARVRSNGTFDLVYDDGEEEKKGKIG